MVAVAEQPTGSAGLIIGAAVMSRALAHPVPGAGEGGSVFEEFLYIAKISDHCRQIQPTNYLFKILKRNNPQIP